MVERPFGSYTILDKYEVIMKTRIIGLLAVCMWLLGGCAVVKDIQHAYQEIPQSSMTDSFNTVEMSSSERAIVTHALNKYSEFYEKWKLENSISDPDAFLADFSDLSSQYTAVRKIVESKWGLLSDTQKAEFTRYDASFNSLIKASANFKKAEDMKKLIMVVGKMAIAAAGMVKL